MFEQPEIYTGLRARHRPSLTKGDAGLLLRRGIAPSGDGSSRSERERLLTLEYAICLPAGAPQDICTLEFWAGVHTACCKLADDVALSAAELEALRLLTELHAPTLRVEDRELILGRALVGSSQAMAAVWLVDESTIRARLRRLQAMVCEPAGIPSQNPSLVLWGGLHAVCCLGQKAIGATGGGKR